MTRIWRGRRQCGKHVNCNQFLLVSSSFTFTTTARRTQLPSLQVQIVCIVLALYISLFSVALELTYPPFLSVRCLQHKNCNNTLSSYRLQAKLTITSNSSTRRRVPFCLVFIAFSNALAHPCSSCPAAHEISRSEQIRTTHSSAQSLRRSWRCHPHHSFPLCQLSRRPRVQPHWMGSSSIPFIQGAGIPRTPG
jgi:hypothetical protein